MRILYAKSFDRDIDAVGHNKEAKKRLLEIIEKLQGIDSLNELKGSGSFKSNKRFSFPVTQTPHEIKSEK